MLFRSRKSHLPPPWLYPKPADDHRGEAGQSAEARAAADEALLDALQQAAFDYFVRHTHPVTGLVADASREGSPSSIAAVGFALSSYPIGVERGWITRDDAVRHTLLAMRFFMASDQSGEPGATGHRGFYFHFLDMQTGARTWHCELSMIDTAVLIAGCLTAAAYFTRDTPDESALRSLADALYRRVDWHWAQAGGDAVSLGWKPGSGFLNYGWQGYNEALILYVLGLGSPTHPLDDASFRAWTMTFQWENLYGYDVLYAGPLFIHQLSHAWIDLRGIRDRFMREKRCDYFENSRRATYIHREYATRNPLGFKGYAEDCWGHSAGDGPVAAPIEIEGRQQSFLGYAARGAPHGPDDGTLAGPAALGSIAFAPEIVLPMVRQLAARPGADDAGTHRSGIGRTVLASGFNATVPSSDAGGWRSAGRLGLDQGLVVMMIENHRSGLPWRIGRDVACLRQGLKRAGFSGGWLRGREAQPR